MSDNMQLMHNCLMRFATMTYQFQELEVHCIRHKVCHRTEIGSFQVGFASYINFTTAFSDEALKHPEKVTSSEVPGIWYE